MGKKIKTLTRIFGAVALAGSVAWALARPGHSATVKALPTAKDFLKEKGYDSTLIANLSDRADTIRVRDLGTTRGYLHSYFDFLSNSAFYGHKPNQFSPVATFYGSERRFIDLPDSTMTIKESICEQYNLPPALVEIDPLSRRDAFLQGFLHEISHHNNPEWREGVSINSYVSEGQADVESLQVLMAHGASPETAKAVLHFRALYLIAGYGADIHDMSLYIDASLNETETPSNAEMHDATEQLCTTVNEILEHDPESERKSWYTPADGETAKYMGEMLEGVYRYLDHMQTTRRPPYREPEKTFTLRRAELYRDAMEYYMPGFAARVRAYVDNLHTRQPCPTPVPN